MPGKFGVHRGIGNFFMGTQKSVKFSPIYADWLSVDVVISRAVQRGKQEKSARLMQA
jgi:hypothetical protein